MIFTVLIQLVSQFWIVRIRVNTHCQVLEDCDRDRLAADCTSTCHVLEDCDSLLQVVMVIIAVILCLSPSSSRRLAFLFPLLLSSALCSLVAVQKDCL